MKKLAFIILVLSLASCSKEGLLPNTVSSQNNGVKTNFTNLSDWGASKDIHPFYTALDEHKYRFEIYAGKGIESGETSSYSSKILDGAGNPMNIGAVMIGGFEAKRDQYGHYSSDGVNAGTPLYSLFGKTKTTVVFPGLNGNISGFTKDIHLPKPLFIAGLSGISTPINISRNGDMPVTIEADNQNDGLPLAVTVTWDKNIDLANSGHKFDLVVNKFLVNDRGGFDLSAQFFKDMPKEAKSVVVAIWRGNAVVEETQDFYVLGYTNTYFPVNLTD
jgi:hypothetical protein